MGRLIVLVGLSGSGKSYYAEQFKAVDDAICTGVTVIHSSDAIREELLAMQVLRKITVEFLSS